MTKVLPLLVLFSLLMSPAQALENLEVTPLMDHHFRPGHNYPLAFTVTTEEKPFQGRLTITVDEIQYIRHLQLPPHTRRRFWIPILLQKKYQKMGITTHRKGEDPFSWDQKGKKITENLSRLEGWDTLAGHYGSDYSRRQGALASVEVGLPQIPPGEHYLEAFDFIFLHSLPAREERKVLLTWVEMGGILISTEDNWKRAFGFQSSNEKVTSRGLGVVVWGEIREDLAYRIPWAKGRMNPLEDRRLVELALAPDYTFSGQRYYLAFFLAYFGLIFVFWNFSSSLRPRRFIVLLAVGTVAFSLLAVLFLPRNGVIARGMVVFRGWEGQREVVGEDILFLKGLAAPTGISLATSWSFVQPLYFSRESLESDSLVLSGGNISHLEVSSQVPRVLVSRSHRRLSSSLSVTWEKAGKGTLRNGMAFGFRDCLLVKDRECFQIGDLSGGKSKSFSIENPQSLAKIARREDLFKNDFYRQALPYLSERFLASEKLYLIAWSEEKVKWKIKSPQLASYRPPQTLWIFEISR